VLKSAAPVRKPYRSDVSDEEWAFVAPYLALLREDAPQRDHSLREVFNGLRYAVKSGVPWRWLLGDLPLWYTVYQQAQLAAGFHHCRFTNGELPLVKR
jgi:transposase